SVPHRDLPSLPTRRSSDLVDRVVEGGHLLIEPLAELLRHGLGELRGHDQDEVVPADVADEGPRPDQLVGHLDGQTGDDLDGAVRSEEHTSELSHVSISYAV